MDLFNSHYMFCVLKKERDNKISEEEELSKKTLLIIYIGKSLHYSRCFIMYKLHLA